MPLAPVRSWLLLASTTALVACSTGPDKSENTGTTEASEEDAPPVFCSGTTAHRWDITDTEDVDLFPDGLLEVPDASTPTGRRLEVTEDTARWLPGTPGLLMNAVLTMNNLSGFGTVGGILVRFDGGTVQDVPLTAEDSVSGDGWQLVDLGGSTPERVPFEVDIQEDGVTAVVWPLRPLKLGHEHAFVITTAASADDGGCIAPTDTTQALVYGDTLPDHPNAEETAERYRAALDTMELRPDDISVLSVFTTHDETLKWRAIAEEAAAEEVEWGNMLGCTDRGEVLECNVYTSVLDRRNADGLVDPDVEPSHERIPVTVWMPATGDGPFPVIMYGHGLGSRRSEGYLAGKLMGEAGVAVVAMDAVSHGDHPSAEGGGDDYSAALGFLGLDLTTLSINPNLLRGNFDQTNLDRLRLLQLILNEPDFDGDGRDDFDTDRIGYLGISLGAILGSQLLSVSPEIDGAVFSVGGGRLMSIVTDTQALTDFEDIISSLVGSKERFDRLVPLAQHVVDPADSALWGAHVLKDRFDDAPAPSLLLQVGLDDEVVPKTSGYALARAMGLPHMAPVAEPVALLDEVNGPLLGNGADGATHALFQFDRVTTRGRVGPAYHVETPTSDEGQLQMRVFLEGWLDNGVPEVVDPYAELGTPEL